MKKTPVSSAGFKLSTGSVHVPYVMGVPRAPLNMSRGVDFPFGDSRPTNKNFLNVYKLKQLRV